MDRRETLKVLALAPFAFTWSPSDAGVAAGKVRVARKPGSFPAQFFTDEELKTVRILVDMILPADERSGSATDLGVPEFIDTIMIVRPAMQTPMRGGLAWLHAYAEGRFDVNFAEASVEQQRALLDAIAYPEDADPALLHGVAFFNSFRDLTAAGFWTTREGMEDLGYMGNTFVAEWTGAPDGEIERLGLDRAPWDTV